MRLLLFYSFAWPGTFYGIRNSIGESTTWKARCRRACWCWFKFEKMIQHGLGVMLMRSDLSCLRHHRPSLVWAAHKRHKRCHFSKTSWRFGHFDVDVQSRGVRECVFTFSVLLLLLFALCTCGTNDFLLRELNSARMSSGQWALRNEQWVVSSEPWGMRNIDATEKCRYFHLNKVLLNPLNGMKLSKLQNIYSEIVIGHINGVEWRIRRLFSEEREPLPLEV